MNAHCERFNRTIQKEFVDYHEDLLFQDDLDEFNRALAEWLAFYNTERPHQALGLKPPIQTLFTDHPKRQMLWTSTPVMPVRSLNEPRPGVLYRLAVGYTGNGMAWLAQEFEADGVNNLDYRCGDETFDHD